MADYAAAGLCVSCVCCMGDRSYLPTYLRPMLGTRRSYRTKCNLPTVTVLHIHCRIGCATPAACILHWREMCACVHMHVHVCTHALESTKYCAAANCVRVAGHE